MPCFCENGREERIHVLNERVVAAIGEHEINLGASGDIGKNFQRQAGDADSANFSRLLQFAHGRNGFMDDLFTIDRIRCHGR